MLVLAVVILLVRSAGITVARVNGAGAKGSAVAMLVVRSTAGDVARMDGAGAERYVIFDESDGH